MRRNHSLATILGIRPSTVKIVFRILAWDWTNVSMADFKSFCGPGKPCFQTGAHAVRGDDLRKYFAERGRPAGNAFMRIYNKYKQ